MAGKCGISGGERGKSGILVSPPELIPKFWRLWAFPAALNGMGRVWNSGVLPLALLLHLEPVLLQAGTLSVSPATFPLGGNIPT